MSSRPGLANTPQRDQLIESHLPLARKMARRYSGRGEPFDDLVQVGALGLLRASDRFDPSRGASFGTFAARVIDGEIRRHLRARSNGAVIAGEEPAEDIRDPCEPLAASEARAFLSGSGQALDERERRVVFLRFQADMTERQIGSLLGISQPQVSRVLRQALDKLRTELGTPLEAGEESDIAPSGVISAQQPAAAGEIRRSDAGGVAQRSSHSRRRETVAGKSGGYSGRFLVRMPGELHEELARCAQEANVSLNRLVTDVLAASTSPEPSEPLLTEERDTPGAERPEAGEETDTPGLTRGLRLAIAANVSVVIVTAAVAVILLVAALQRGI